MKSIQRSTPVLVLGLLAASAACVGHGDAASTGSGGPESTRTTTAPLTIANVVTNGAFTNLYVYPDPSRESWDDHLKGLPPSLLGQSWQSYKSEAIDAAVDRVMKPQFPSYFGQLGQYGVNQPKFFGSGAVSQACIDAAMADANNGVLEWTTVRSLANCHVDGMDPSPQINLIFSPDIAIGDVSWPQANGPDICSLSGFHTVAYHAWGLNMPNFTAIPTNVGCASNFDAFTNSLSHELVETLTDPGSTGIGGLGFTEIGDACQAPVDDHTTNLDNPHLDLARYWSNSDNGCQPRLDSPAGSTSRTWVLGQRAQLVNLTSSTPSATLPAPAGRTTTNTPATQVSVVLQAASVSSGATLHAQLNFAGGTTAPVAFTLVSGQMLSAVINLPSPAPNVSDITGVTIWSDPMQTGAIVNIDAAALVVSFASTAEPIVPPGPIVDTWLDASALPLVRMTGDVHDITLPLPTPNPDLGYPVQALNVVISTGNDDLRGGSNPGDDCDVTVTLNSGQTITVPNVNGWQTWPGWSINTVSIPVPAGLKGGDIRSVSLHTGFGGGVDGDNWNVERVQLLATLVPPPPVIGQLVPASGLPAGAQTVTINGANFDTTGQTQFFFDGAPATNVACTSRTQCTVTNPPGSGAARVTATGQGGSSTNSNEFDYAPSVTGLSATTGSQGDTITVYGIGLFQGETTFSFGPYPVQTATYTSSGAWSVLVPGGAGAVDVRAFVNGVETTAVSGDKFTYAVPVVGGIDVTSGPVSGYTTFNLDGSYFPGALWSSTYAPPTILFGGVPALYVFCPYTNWCTGWTPPVSKAGPVQVTVVENGVPSTGSVTFDYWTSENIADFWVTQTGATIQFWQPIPAGGAAVSVSCSDPSMMPTQLIQLSAGATGASVQFPAWTKNETVTLSASYAGYSVNALLDAVVPPPPPPPPPPSDAGTPTCHTPATCCLQAGGTWLHGKCQ